MGSASQKVDFFIIGQPKSGTTTLAEFLGRQERIEMAVPKEPDYMADDIRQESDSFHGYSAYYPIRKVNEYLHLFSGDKKGAIWGEASTVYLYSRAAASNIYHHNSDAKIIIILREPVSFLQALHRQYLNETTEQVPELETALSLESARRQGQSLPSNTRCPSLLFYSDRVRFAEQISRYYALFPPHNILVLSIDDLKADGKGVCKKVLGFLGLGVQNTVLEEPGIVNSQRQARVPWLNSFLNSPVLKKYVYILLGQRLYTGLQKRIIERMMFQKYASEAISPTLERCLRHQCLPEVRKLSELTGRDFMAEWGYKESGYKV